MLDLSFNIALAIVAASLAGSVHCVGMCGGLMLSATGPRMSRQVTYHVFRLLGYLMMGGFAGYLGNELFQWRWLPLQVFISTVFVTALFLKVPLSKFGMSLGYRLGKQETSWIRPVMIGFFTVFLPCGWLYGFVLLATTTHSVFYGMLVLTLFWLGTLPALTFSRVIMQSIFAKLGVSGKKVVFTLMLCATLISVYEHWQHAFHPSHGISNTQQNCGMSHKSKNSP